MKRNTYEHVNNPDEWGHAHGIKDDQGLIGDGISLQFPKGGHEHMHAHTHHVRTLPKLYIHMHIYKHTYVDPSKLSSKWSPGGPWRLEVKILKLAVTNRIDFLQGWPGLGWPGPRVYDAGIRGGDTAVSGLSRLLGLLSLTARSITRSVGSALMSDVASRMTPSKDRCSSSISS